MNTIQFFNNDQFGGIRVTTDQFGNPLFCLTDICKALNLTNPSVVAQKLDDEDKPKLDLGLPGQMPTYVTEPGLYMVILRSDSPLAKPIQKWITNDVLPSIRQKGYYALDHISRKDLAKMVLEAEDAKERLESENHKKTMALREAAPKVLFADAVCASSASILIGELAKILKQNGINIGQNRLFEWLRANEYLCRRGESHNLPTQYAMELGLFEIKKTSINCPDGTIFVSETTKVTPKGQIYFVNKFLNAA